LVDFEGFDEKHFIKILNEIGKLKKYSLEELDEKRRNHK